MRINNKITLLFLFLYLCLSFASSAYAQNKVSGYIELIPFQTGVDSAEVIITNVSNGKKSAVLSDSLGNFSFNSVPSGSYNVAVKAAGYMLYDNSSVSPVTISGNYTNLDIH